MGLINHYRDSKFSVVENHPVISELGLKTSVLIRGSAVLFKRQ